MTSRTQYSNCTVELTVNLEEDLQRRLHDFIQANRAWTEELVTSTAIALLLKRDCNSQVAAQQLAYTQGRVDSLRSQDAGYVDAVYWYNDEWIATVPSSLYEELKVWLEKQQLTPSSALKLAYELFVGKHFICVV